MKALSVKQPWASLIRDGIKTLEVRSWRTDHRGSLLIVASKQPDRRPRASPYAPERPVYGAAVCLVTLVDVRQGTPRDRGRALVNPQGQFVWELEDAMPVEPIRITGQMGLYSVPDRFVVASM